MKVLLLMFFCFVGPVGFLFSIFYLLIFLVSCFFGVAGGTGSVSDYTNIYSSHHEYGPEDDEWGEANTDGWYRPHHFDDDW